MLYGFGKMCQFEKGVNLVLVLELAGKLLILAFWKDFFGI